MQWLESILYGLISGFAEFLPVSSQAHQNLLLKFFGQTQRDYVRDLCVHIALLLCLLTACRSLISQMRREQLLRQRNRRTRRGSHGLHELRFLKSTGLVLILGTLILSYVAGKGVNMVWLSVLLFMNGLLLIATERMMQGNKDERFVSGLDSLLLGASGTLSVIPGLSRTGTMLSTLKARGFGRKKALNWVLLLSIPALGLLIALDLINIMSNASDLIFWSNIGWYILSALFAYLGGIIGISILRALTERAGYSGFAYYCWGASLFTFIFYLTVV